MSRHADHYELVDLRLANQLAGALWICGALYVIALAVFDPPASGREQAALAIPVAIAIVLGTARLWRGSSSPSLLLVSAHAACGLVAVVTTAAADASAYGDLLFLIIGYCAFLHPAGRLLGILAAASLAALVPTVDSAGTGVAAAAGQVVLLNGMAALVFAASENARGLRREVLHQRRQADVLARVDALTGLANRRALDEELLVRCAETARSRRALSLLVADLDRFKAINDSAGHREGDRVLGEIAAVLRDCGRTGDLCFRWGGDEFVVLLPDTELADAEMIADRLGEAVRSRVSGPGGEPVTLTAGAAVLTATETGQELLARADAALVRRKAARRAALALETAALRPLPTAAE